MTGQVISFPSEAPDVANETSSTLKAFGVLEVLVRWQIAPAGLQCLQVLDLHTCQIADSGSPKHRKALRGQGGVELVGWGQWRQQGLLRHENVREIRQRMQA